MTHREHYDTLGITPSATGEEIHAAYRKRAREVHPDRGGTNEDMVKVNHAYNLLRDHKARTHYDGTGQERKLDTFEHDVRANLYGLVTRLLEQHPDGGVDMITLIRANLANARQIHMQDQEQARIKLARAKRQRSLLKRRTRGENIFDSLFDEREKVQASNIEDAAYALRILDAVAVLIVDYESELARTFLPPNYTFRIGPT